MACFRKKWSLGVFLTWSKIDIFVMTGNGSGEVLIYDQVEQRLWDPDMAPSVHV